MASADQFDEGNCESPRVPIGTDGGEVYEQVVEVFDAKRVIVCIAGSHNEGVDAEENPEAAVGLNSRGDGPVGTGWWWSVSREDDGSLKWDYEWGSSGHLCGSIGAKRRSDDVAEETDWSDTDGGMVTTKEGLQDEVAETQGKGFVWSWWMVTKRAQVCVAREDFCYVSDD